MWGWIRYYSLQRSDEPVDIFGDFVLSAVACSVGFFTDRACSLPVYEMRFVSAV